MTLTTKTVTFQLYRPDGSAETRRLRFELIPGSYDDDGVLARRVVYATPDTTGAGEIDLWANEGGVVSSRYEVTLPSGETHRFTVPTSGSTFTLSELLELGVTSSDPQFPSLLSLLGEVDVRLYGATGDGTTDDTSAIDAALAVVNVAGGSLYFPQGIYRTTGGHVVRNAVRIRGDGPEASKILNVSTSPTFTFASTVLPNRELRFTSIEDIWLHGNSGTNAAQKGIKVENPFHFTTARLKVELFGGIGIDIEKGASGSTYGQSVYIDTTAVLNCLKGGIRIYTQGVGNSVDIASIRRSTLNENKPYGIYLHHVVACEIENCEFAGYGNVTPRGVPIAVNGGNNIAIKGACSFEGNDGDGATQNYNIRFGWDGDLNASTGVSGANTDVVLIQNNDFKPPNGTGDITHIWIDWVRCLVVEGNLFEGSASRTVKGVQFSTNLAQTGVFRFTTNRWTSTLNTKLVGTPPPLIWQDVPLGLLSDAVGAIAAYGFQGDALTQVPFWTRYVGESFDRFQILIDGTIKVGDGTGAPVQKCAARVVATASLPAAGAAMDGTVIIEDAGAGNRNLIIYAGGERFRIDGGANV